MGGVGSSIKNMAGGLGGVLDFGCGSIDVSIFLMEKPYIWVPAVMAGGISTGLLGKYVLGDMATLPFAGLGSVLGLSVAYHYGADGVVSKGCESVVKVALTPANITGDVVSGHFHDAWKDFKKIF